MCIRASTFAFSAATARAKTTLLGILSGVLRPYGGKVIVQNSDLKKIDGKSLYRRNLTLLPQDPQTVFVKNTVKRGAF